MKVSACILAIYIILLSGVPCCSFDNCAEVKTAQAGQHDQNDNDCGDCSPLFTCAGCSAFAFTVDPLEIQVSPLNTLKIFTGYIEQDVPEMNYDFWQPPRIG